MYDSEWMHDHIQEMHAAAHYGDDWDDRPTLSELLDDECEGHHDEDDDFDPAEDFCDGHHPGGAVTGAAPDGTFPYGPHLPIITPVDSPEVVAWLAGCTLDGAREVIAFMAARGWAA